jgi:hypothetical protein
LSGYFVVVPVFLHDDPDQPDNPNNPAMWMQAHNPAPGVFFTIFLLKLFLESNSFRVRIFLADRSTSLQMMASVNYVEIVRNR